jgi:hypothetical protein
MHEQDIAWLASIRDCFSVRGAKYTRLPSQAVNSRYGALGHLIFWQVGPLSLSHGTRQYLLENQSGRLIRMNLPNRSFLTSPCTEN